MEYHTVEVLGTGKYHPYHDLIIDGVVWAYDIYIDNTTRFGCSIGGIEYNLPIALPLNRDNPKETLDKFFKLLMLQ